MPSIKSALTLGVLVLLLVVGVAWGVAQVSKPFPGKVDRPICVETSYQAGERLYPQDVTVSVLNASKREGLAGRTMQALVDEGFARGQSGNAPEGTNVPRAQVWTTDADNPAVLLVRSRFRKAEVIETPDPGAVGIVVVVGDNLPDSLAKGRPSILAKDSTVVCGPDLG
ncbi:LytR C-terminal domain-containing protein [Nocardioides sp.]|uniref:LytR C-terminal domain-containing protein n=1 Tax=Nocardioides sp. TaxID=35761 RepID=UPI00356B4FAC